MWAIKHPESELYYTNKRCEWTSDLQEARTYPSHSGAANARNHAETEAASARRINERVQGSNYTAPPEGDEPVVIEVELREV